jgi:protein SCO1/2
MKPDLRRRGLITLGGALSASSVLAQVPAWKDVDPRERIRQKYFPNVALTTHEGKLVRFYDDLIRDRTVMINFMYVNCGDGGCPVTTHTLAKVHKLLGDRVGRDVFMYSITLDPENDSPAALRKYAKSHHADLPGWTFLRAEPRDTEVLRRKLGFYDRDPVVDRDKSSHASMVRYGNEPRQRWAMSSTLVPAQSIARVIGWVSEPSTQKA